MRRSRGPGEDVWACCRLGWLTVCVNRRVHSRHAMLVTARAMDRRDRASSWECTRLRSSLAEMDSPKGPSPRGACVSHTEPTRNPNAALVSGGARTIGLAQECLDRFVLAYGICTSADQRVHLSGGQCQARGYGAQP